MGESGELVPGADRNLGKARPDNAHSDCFRCMAPAGQRRGADPDQDPRGAGKAQSRGRGDRPGPVPPNPFHDLRGNRTGDPALPTPGKANPKSVMEGKSGSV